MTTQNEPADSAEMTRPNSAPSDTTISDTTVSDTPPQEAAHEGDASNDPVLPETTTQATAPNASASAVAATGVSDASEGSASEMASSETAADDNTTVALEMADLAAAVQTGPENNGDTRPIPILATRLQPPDTPVRQSAPAHAAGETPPAISTDSAAPADAPVAGDAARTAHAAEELPLDATPKATRRPTPYIVPDDPNVTHQLASSGGLTGLDVLGSLDASNGSRANATKAGEPLPGGIADELDPAWALADQPTMQFPPQTRIPARPAFLETGEQEVWPPRPTPAPTVPRDGQMDQSDHETPPPFEPTANPRPIPRPATRPILPNERLASPTGRRPLGNADAAYSDARRRRYVELQMQRGAHEHGQRGPVDTPPITQMVRQWWKDLMPGLQKALDHQHEARASGVYPLPAHDVEPKMGTRMGDVFGRLAAAVRDLGERAQSAAMPAIKGLHERAEHTAQAIVGKLEGPQLRQQAPFLGPGRLAVFFRQGVTVGQAQRLLMVHRAQPMRLIPRKHGFLARVMPGREAEVGAELRQHPYVRDVVYLEYDGPAAAVQPAAAH